MARGYSTRGDVITQSADGRPLDDIFREAQAAVAALNSQQDSLRTMLSYSMATQYEDVLQLAVVDDMEEASEYGVPKAIRAPSGILKLGANFKDFDSRSAYTWKFLRDASAAQVEAQTNALLQADNNLIFRAVMGALFNNVNRTNPEGSTVFALYNNDGTVPPEYLGQTFLSSHNHYLTSGNANFDGQDLVDLMNLILEHGYGAAAAGGQLLIFMNPVQARQARGFRAGVITAPATVASPYDFIVNNTAPPFLTQDNLVGQRAPDTFGRIPLIGSYGPAFVAEDYRIPAGYVVCVASGGAGSPLNPVMFREHANTAYRGLRIIPGGETYPLQDSFFTRGFGTGIRHRGAAAVMQITAAGSYTVPAAYTAVAA